MILLNNSGHYCNCKKCFRKVLKRAPYCHHCREPDPQLKADWAFGYDKNRNVDYMKRLDPDARSVWRSLWDFMRRKRKQV